MKRVIAILDLAPRRAIASVRESVEYAADRWGAEVHWIKRPLQPCHPFWQKMFVCGSVVKRFGPSHVLQLDNDMLIRSDCPSPFDLASPDKFAIVAERQCALNRLDDGGWQRKSHEEWGKRCRLLPAPAWIHPNGGFYLYGTDAFTSLFERIAQYLIVTYGASDWASDEALIINQLWHDRPDDIVFLPGDFNVSMLQNTDWAANPVMQSFIYHFIGQSKSRMDGCRWQRTDPPELPHPWDKATQPIIDAFGTSPPASFDLGQVVRAETAANLLAVYPELIVSGTWTTKPAPSDPVLLQQASKTYTAHLLLTRLLLRLGVNARRFHLRITDEIDVDIEAVLPVTSA